MEKQILKLPAILCDIDGVLIRGKECIPRSDKAIKILKNNLNDLDPVNFSNVDQQIPLVLITNGGGNVESKHAQYVNQRMNLTQEKDIIEGSQMVVNFSPLRPIIEQYRDENKLILIAGSYNYLDIVQEMNITNYITVYEYLQCFPDLVPLSNVYVPVEQKYETWKIIKNRLNLQDKDFEYPLQVNGIFLLYEPTEWENVIQLVCDLCTTKDGRIADKPVDKSQVISEHVPLYIVNNDIVYRSDFRLPRLAFGSFNLVLRNTARLLYNIDLKIEMCGKPEKITYDYGIKIAKQRANGHELGKLYMIGDNPMSDIRGANRLGIVSILVKTGVWQKEYNCQDDPATHLVNDFFEAVKLIFKLEGIKYNFKE